jgi:hypothetical protein
VRRWLIVVVLGLRVVGVLEKFWKRKKVRVDEIGSFALLHLLTRD